VAEGPDEGRAPDVWGDLPDKVARGGFRDGRLWVDDSKQVNRGGQGLDRLEAAAWAALDAAGRPLPERLGGLLGALEAGTLAEAELDLWLEPGDDPAVPRPESLGVVGPALEQRPFDGAPWRIVALRTVVVGPARFNAALSSSGNGSKATAHFAAFAGLARWLWADTAAGGVTHVRADKHGGRHFYLDPLYRAFPDVWIDRGPEGRELSCYTVREGGADGRRLELELRPRADAEDGLVALASIISKLVREHWMAAFNAHWVARVPGLRPTAGYPGDAARFRAAIEDACRARGLTEDRWWRPK
jgi:hypothetical protein